MTCSQRHNRKGLRKQKRWLLITAVITVYYRRYSQNLSFISWQKPKRKKRNLNFRFILLELLKWCSGVCFSFLAWQHCANLLWQRTACPKFIAVTLLKVGQDRTPSSAPASISLRIEVRGETVPSLGHVDCWTSPPFVDAHWVVLTECLVVFKTLLALYTVMLTYCRW